MDLMIGVFNLINGISKEAYPKYVVHLDDETTYMTCVKFSCPACSHCESICGDNHEPVIKCNKNTHMNEETLEDCPNFGFRLNALPNVETYREYCERIGYDPIEKHRKDMECFSIKIEESENYEEFKRQLIEDIASKIFTPRIFTSDVEPFTKGDIFNKLKE